MEMRSLNFFLTSFHLIEMVNVNSEQVNRQTFFLNRYLDKDDNHLYTQYDATYQPYIKTHEMQIQIYTWIQILSQTQ
jgi:hypothetical protein